MTREQGAKVKKLKPGVPKKLKGVLKTPDKLLRENRRQVAQKMVRIAQKVMESKQFQQIYKTQERKILSYTPLAVGIQTIGKQPRLLRNLGFAFVPNPKMYGNCRPTQLNDLVAYKFVRYNKSYQFLDIAVLESDKQKDQLAQDISNGKQQ